MSAFKITEHTIGTQVVETGTFVVSYPTNRDAGFYRNAFGHRIVTETGDLYKHPEDFTVSHGATGMTVTWANARTLTVGTLLYVQFNENADQAFQNEARAVRRRDIYRAKQLVPMRIDLGAPDVLDADGYCVSQDLTAAGVFSVSATAAAAILAAALVGTADVPRNVVAAWTTTAILTITGTDEYGQTMVEKSASGTTLTGKKAFKTVTNIATSASITALTVGTGDVIGLPIHVPTVSNLRRELQSGVSLAKFGPHKIYIPIQISSTDLLAGTAQQFNAPCAGYITGLRGICQVGVTTGGDITVEANTVAVVGLSITVANSATAGTQYNDSVLKIATGLCAAGDDCTVTPAAAFATAGEMNVEVIFEPIEEANGTFVAGVATEPTATSGDVRGTYDPIEVCNGTLEFSLYVDVEDPDYLGLEQFTA